MYMIYRFNLPELGCCKLERRTSGKQGFCVPKLFTVSSLDTTNIVTRSYRFIDRIISGTKQSQLKDWTLSRLAIGQFLAELGDPGLSEVRDLDLTSTPYKGFVVNSRGTDLPAASVPSLYLGPTISIAEIDAAFHERPSGCP
jgi:hypothetical protein